MDPHATVQAPPSRRGRYRCVTLARGQTGVWVIPTNVTHESASGAHPHPGQTRWRGVALSAHFHLHTPSYRPLSPTQGAPNRELSCPLAINPRTRIWGIGPAGVERGREPHHRVPPQREAHTSAAWSCHGAGPLIPLQTPQHQGGTPSLIQWATPGHNTRGSGQGLHQLPPLSRRNPSPKGGAWPVGGAGIPAANPLYQGGTPV